MNCRNTKSRMVGRLVVVLVFLAAAAVADDGPAHRLELQRPVLLGVSGGNIEDFSSAFCCSGTLGGLVEDADGKLYVLSNNHVLGRTNQGLPGEAILQPGLIDQEVACLQDAGDTVAQLTRFVPISFKRGSTNVVDAAIAEIVPGRVDPSGAILDIGTVASETAQAFVGQAVTKSGRTTGRTFGEVLAIDVTVDVAYTKECGLGRRQVARFVRQILVGPADFSAGGDSGSLVVEDADVDPRPVGLLFAGSETSTLVNPIDDVLVSLCVAMRGASSFPDPAACSSGGGGGGGPGKGKKKGVGGPFGIAAAVKARHEQELLDLPGVVGAGLGLDRSGRPTIEVYLARATSPARAALPRSLEGIPVRAVETGVFYAR
ncbi:MAG: hypothetical protein KatS3mg076_2142 [Candidatus Binatia bacterium]|nr:MAG: hypothetical protein KatS3mg076_2142 [Candidatus Binatia bacterium]